MLKFYYNPAYKYTNRAIIDLTGDSSFKLIDYENVDSPDTINGHIIYVLASGESIPTYVVDTETGWRWFVSGITQLRTGKYQISLLRDIISESPNTWKTEQAYITAGTAANFNKYKRWNLPYTNTKIKQEKLTINGKSSFFVFYVNEQHVSSDIISETDLIVKYATVPGITNFDYQVSNITDIPSSQFLNAGPVHHWAQKAGAVALRLVGSNNSIIDGLSIYFNLGNTSLVSSINWQGYLTSSIPVQNVQMNYNNCLTYAGQAIDTALSQYQATLGTSITSTQRDALEPYVDKYIHDTTSNKVYIIRKTSYPVEHNEYMTNSTLLSALRNINWGITGSITNESGNWFNFKSRENVYNYTLEEVGTATTFNFNFIAGVRKLPRSAVRCVNIVSDSTHNDEQITQCLMLAQTNGINPDNTTGRILDIQYLPFSIATTTNSNLQINNTSLTAQFLDTDDFTYNIDLTDLTGINKETDTIKIVSPSRASQFLFRPYDNDGNMEFGAKITLKPYASTIYIRPSTKGLLKYDWDDKDCLIIQEDFSLTNVTSEWTQYVYNNKNYSNIFEREMQGRTYQRIWEVQVEMAQAKSDEWTARNISAEKARTYTGNIPIISGIAGAIGTAFKDKDYMEAAQIDRDYNQALYEEGMSLSRDMFSYQLDNIKSQPLIPSKITTLDCKTLDGIYLEFYSTNETELNAISNFYKYNGNRIDDYGTFADYWGNFVRGKIIISLNYTQPEIDELNRRLAMGIFTGGVL